MPDLHFQDKELLGAIACTPAEATMLYIATRNFQPRNLLEIGSYIGWSSAHIALAAAGLLTCVDPFIEIGPYLKEKPDERAKQRFLDNIKRAGLSDKVQLICGKSPDVLQSIAPSSGWDFVFIDGWHLDGQPIRDVAGLLPFLSESAILILHDLWIADVRDAACYLRALGWTLHIFNTANYLTFAWKIQPNNLKAFLASVNHSKFVNQSAAIRSNRVVRGLTDESIESFASILSKIGSSL